jgi:hypothetical protein
MRHFWVDEAAQAPALWLLATQSLSRNLLDSATCGEVAQSQATSQTHTSRDACTSAPRSKEYSSPNCARANHHCTRAPKICSAQMPLTSQHQIGQVSTCVPDLVPSSKSWHAWNTSIPRLACDLDAWSNSLINSTLKWRVKREVMGLRPPPGGPMAASSCRSTSCLNVLSARSYLWDQGNAASQRIALGHSLYQTWHQPRDRCTMLLCSAP